MLKKIISLLLTVYILFFPQFLINVHSQEVSFDIKTQSIIGEISADGSVKFTDELTYDIDYMNGILFTLDRKGYEIKDYKVAIRDTITNDIEYLQETPSGARGTFQVEQTENNYTFRVYYPTENEQISIIFEYTIAELITNFSDTAELSRMIVGTKTDEYVDVEAVLVLPGKVQIKEDFRAWAHGAPQGEVELIEYSGKSAVRIEVPNNPPNQSVEAIVIFPASLTPNNPNRKEVEKKESIINRENRQVESDRQSYAKQLGWIRFWGLIFSVSLPLAPLGTGFYYFVKRRELNPNPVKLPEHIYTLPEDITPALMATSVYRNAPIAEDMTATIVDLARKKILKLEEINRENRGMFARGEKTTVRISKGKMYENSKQLQKHEQYALDYVLPKGVESTTLQELEEQTSRNKVIAKRQYTLWNKFTNFAQVKGMQIKGTTKENSFAKAFALVSVIGIPFVLIILVSILNRTPYQHFIGSVIVLGGVSWIGSLFVAAIVFLKPIRTAQQDRRIQEWNGFKNMLENVGNMNMREIATLDLWEEYLVYAISLGVADKVVKTMQVQFRPTELESMNVGGRIYYNPYLFTRTMNRSISQSVQSSQPAPVKYSGSNTGGFGGGFSSGSSGSSGGGSGAGGF